MTWIYVLNFYINFCAGLLLALLPRIDMEKTGVIYGFLFLCKAVFMIPAGYWGDKFGHQRLLTLAILAQTIGFTLLAWKSEFAIYGRSFEGVALACGAVACIAIFRSLSKDEQEFTNKIKILFGTGSLGYILGPVVGFLFKQVDLQIVVGGLAASSLLFFIIQIFSKRLTNHFVSPLVSTEHPFSLGHFLLLIVPLGAVKGLGRAYEPLISYWSQYSLSLNSLVAGITFAVLGASFLIGTQWVHKLKKIVVFIAGILGIFVMNYSLNNSGTAWLVSIFLFGLWYGFYLTLGLAYVGWRRNSNVGVYTSIWMLLSDLGTIVMPMWFWQIRDPEYSLLRSSFTLLILVVVGICYAWYGRRHELK